MQRYAAQNLHVEVIHIEHALCRLSHDGEGLGQNGIEAFPAFQTGFEQRRALFEPRVRHCCIRVGKSLYLNRNLFQ